MDPKADLKTAALKLNHDDRAVREGAMAVIVQAKRGATGPLTEALAVPGAPVGKIALLLAALEARAAVGPLAGLVNRGVLDADTRAVVARALGELVDARDAHDATVVRALLSLARDTFSTTRVLVVPALRALGDAVSEGRLEEMARTDGDGATRAAAVTALAVLRAARSPSPSGPPPSGPPPSAAPAHPAAIEAGGLHVDLEALVAAHQVSVSSAASSAVSSAASPASPHAALVARLRDPRWSMRNAVVEDIVALAVSARADMLTLLLDVLADTHPGAQIGAAQALARLHAPDAAPALLEVVTKAHPGPDASSEEQQLRPIALKALAASLTGAEEGFAPPLVPLLKDPDAFVRAGALLCLGRLADRVGARAAVLALRDPHEHVREAAAVALSEGAREDDHELVLPLLDLLTALPSPSVAGREAILLALARIHVEDPALRIRLRHRVRPQVLGITSSLRRTAVAILERCYSAADPPPPQVVDDVLGRLRDDNPEVRLLSASFLAHHLTPGLTGAVEDIEDALDRAERAVSLLCLEALRRHDTAKARRALEAALEDPDPAVAERAAALLDGFAPSTLEWQPASVAVEVTAPPPTSSPAPPPAPSAPEASARPRRVRPATGTSTDVVDARDPEERGPGG